MKVLILMLLLIVAGCTTTKYVPVTKTETHMVNVHDTLITHDTLTKETTTLIRELDSAQIAKYGITLANKERAWLIDRQALQRQISNLQRTHSDTIRDTIPITTIVTETKTIPADISAWQKFLINSGGIFVTLLLIYIARKIYQYVRCK